MAWLRRAVYPTDALPWRAACSVGDRRASAEFWTSKESLYMVPGCIFWSGARERTWFRIEG